jgi:glycosyltransferase involved in cell wall biosynthesis
MSEMLVSIIIPVYKKEKTILRDLTNIWEAMNNTRWDFELIAIVDGKFDNSFKEAKQLRKKNVHVYEYATNKGKGYAVRYGMARSQGNIVGYLDSGMEINPNGLSMILEHMEWYDADIIVGSKRHPASKVNLSPMRKVYSYGYYLIARVLFGLRVRDTQAGIKIFKRGVLDKVLPRLLVKRYAFDVELLSVAKSLGFTKICEAPIEIDLDFEGSCFKPKLIPLLDPNIRSMFLDTLGVFYRLNLLNYYDDSSKRKWVYDKELQMRVNTGELVHD